MAAEQRRLEQDLEEKRKTMTAEQAEALQRLELQAEERRKAAESQAQNTTAASSDFDFP